MRSKALTSSTPIRYGHVTHYSLSSLIDTSLSIYLYVDPYDKVLSRYSFSSLLSARFDI